MATVRKRQALLHELMDLGESLPQAQVIWIILCLFWPLSFSISPQRTLCKRVFPSCLTSRMVSLMRTHGDLSGHLFLLTGRISCESFPQSSFSKSREDTLGDSSADLAASRVIPENYGDSGHQSEPSQECLVHLDRVIPSFLWYWKVSSRRRLRLDHKLNKNEEYGLRTSD